MALDNLSASSMMSGGSTFGMMGGSSAGVVTASQIELEQQGFSGTVSNYAANGSQATFTLTLASDSAFTTLTGASTITVFQQAGTTLSGLTSVANSTTVRVRGLLFFDGGTWKLVASRIVGQ